VKVARLEEHAPVQEMTRTKLTVAPKGCPREPARVAFLGEALAAGPPGGHLGEWVRGGMWLLTGTQPRSGTEPPSGSQPRRNGPQPLPSRTQPQLKKTVTT